MAKKFIVLSGIIVLLMACGQKGPLYIKKTPPKNPKASKSKPTQSK